MVKKDLEILWTLLDDIDTASDIIKPTTLEGYKNFYNYVLKIASKRFEVLESDGYNLYYPKKNYPVIEDKRTEGIN